jgi:release factor glutamine methyltransferase
VSEGSEKPPAPAWTVRSLLAWSRDWLAKKGVENPRLDAELLLASAMKTERIRLYIEHDKPLEPGELQRFKALILRRAEREPVAYLLGTKEFYGRPFAVDKRAFIPRPETELLVQAVLAELTERAKEVTKDTENVNSSQVDKVTKSVNTSVPGGSSQSPKAKVQGPLRVLDLCAGSGAVGVTLAAEELTLQVDLVELSPETAEVTKLNAEKHAPGRAHVLVGDLFAPLLPGTRYAAVVSNPPYVPLADKTTLAPEIERHEPHLALFSGNDGLDAIRRIVAQAKDWLEPGGLLALELDPTQAESAIALCTVAGLIAPTVNRDMAGLLRILVAYAPGARARRSSGDGVAEHLGR